MMNENMMRRAAYVPLQIATIQPPPALHLGETNWDLTSRNVKSGYESTM